MVLVNILVHENAFHFEAVVDAALHLLEAELSSTHVFELHEDRAHFCAQPLFSCTDDFDGTELADVLELGFEVVPQLFVLIDCQRPLTVPNI